MFIWFDQYGMPTLIVMFCELFVLGFKLLFEVEVNSIMNFVASFMSSSKTFKKLFS